MSTSLISMLNQQLSGDATRQISQQLGVDERSAQSAINTALPMLLGALGRNTATPEGAASLANALDRDHDGSVLNDISNFLSSGGNPQAGNGILGHALGSNRPAVEQGIANMTGLDATSTSQLLALLAPLVMGGLGKLQREEALDAAGVANLLGDARQEADSQLGGLAQLLDTNRDGSIVDEVVNLGSQLLGGLFGRKS